MISKITSCVTVGLESLPIEVEVDVSSQGLPSFAIVGLPDKAVEEAKERVRSAIRNSNFEFPGHRITVNLAPADIPKEGATFDFPIAVGILKASGQINYDFENTILVGELSLDGSLKRTVGILPVALFAKEKKLEKLFLPAVNAREAAITNYSKIFPTRSLRELFDHIVGISTIIPFNGLEIHKKAEECFLDFDMKDIKGQEQAKRAMEICAAGGHNIILKGPPGSGKTLLARTLPSILPKMTMDESLETTKIYSITGLLKTDEPLITIRPFRSPHHTTSHIGLVGGGQHPRPGEISLAHRGVLFLDELAEFPRLSLEVLRQPLEDGFVSISRARGTLCFPAKFLLVAATNPCPCGYYQDSKHQCVCSSGQILRYQKRISGPLLDRIDLYVEVPSVEFDKLTNDNFSPENSKNVRTRVQKARDLQKKRLEDEGLICNSEMKNKHIKKFCPLSSDCLKILRIAVSRFGLSARSYQKIIKISRTIADLEGCLEICPNHVSEALQYRQKVDMQ